MQTTGSFLEQRMAIGRQAGPRVGSLCVQPRNSGGAAGDGGEGDVAGASTANRLDLNQRRIHKATAGLGKLGFWSC